MRSPYAAHRRFTIPCMRLMWLLLLHMNEKRHCDGVLPQHASPSSTARPPRTAGRRPRSPRRAPQARRCSGGSSPAGPRASRPGPPRRGRARAAARVEQRNSISPCVWRSAARAARCAHPHAVGAPPPAGCPVGSVRSRHTSASPAPSACHSGAIAAAAAAVAAAGRAPVPAERRGSRELGRAAAPRAPPRGPARGGGRATARARGEGGKMVGRGRGEGGRAGGG